MFGLSFGIFWVHLHSADRVCFIFHSSFRLVSSKYWVNKSKNNCPLSKLSIGNPRFLSATEQKPYFKKARIKKVEMLNRVNPTNLSPSAK
jgi:hypothetical protein